jgi:hypothetical protein
MWKEDRERKEIAIAKKANRRLWGFGAEEVVEAASHFGSRVSNSNRQPINHVAPCP